MKKLSISLFLKILILLCFSINHILKAQKDDNDKMMEQMDLSVFEGKIFLNKSIVIDEMLDNFRADGKSNELKEHNLNSFWFNELFNIQERGDLKGKQKPEAVTKILNIPRSEITGNNIIPVGVVNFDAVLLTEQQINKNIESKREGKKPDASLYENFQIILPGLLLDEVFQADVKFHISPELVFSNNDNVDSTIALNMVSLN